jgi:amino acid adenylation domain-containing protein
MEKELQHHFFEATAAAQPDAVAVDDGGTEVTYGELEARANQLARLLVELGCGPNERVCIFTAKGVASYWGLLAALKAGAAWVPLSTAYPADVLRELVHSLAPKAIIGDATTVRQLADLWQSTDKGFTPILLEEEDVPEGFAGLDAISAQPESRAEGVTVSPEDLAYVIFTSGSTGTPKGVMVQHRNTARFLNLCPSFFNIKAGSRFAHFSDLSFDPSIFDLFHCWNSGGTVVPFNQRRYRINPGLFIRERDVNVFFTVPSVVQSIIDSGQLGEAGMENIRHLLLTGEAFSAKLVADWQAVHGHAKIYNMYGTTETAIVSHWYEFPRDIAADTPVPVGKVLDGMRVYLANGEVMVEGAGTGESCVYGPQISPGYWDSQFQTDAAFKPLPGDTGLPQLVYHTGDILRRDEDDLYWYVGRIDAQVKVRGHRVELGEVEQVLRRNLAVTETVVVSVSPTDKNYDNRLVAFVRLLDETPTGDLKAMAEQYLPAYMVPSRIVSLDDDFPRGSNGKANRQELRRMAKDLLQR